MTAQPPPDEFGALLAASQPSNREVALDLGRRGFAVAPIRDWRGEHEWTPIKGWPELATADGSTIEEWWRRWPDARVALVTGKRNGVTVLDLDRKKGKDGVASLRALGFDDLSAVSPVRVRTPSGGYHLFFRYDPRLKNSVGKLGEGIDVRNDRGFVVAPDSLKDGARYEVLGAPVNTGEFPPFPERLVPPVEEELPPVEPLTAPAENQKDWARAELEERVELLATTGEGSRNSDLNNFAMWAGGAAAHGMLTRESAEDALVDAAVIAGLKQREARKTFASGFKAGLAKPIGGYPAAVEDDDFDTLPPLGEGRLRFFTPRECDGAPARGYVIKGLLAPGDVACIYGAPGAGKSLIAPHLGYAVAQGRHAFGMRTKPGRVFYVAAEDPQGMRGRVSALRLRHGEGELFTLVEGVSDLLGKGSPDLKALRQAIEQQQPALVFIDTLAMAFPGLEENSAEGMGRVVAVARRFAELGPAVVLIHHDTKAGTPTPRGHSLLNGALDVALQLVPRDENGIVRGQLSKNRNGPCDRDVAFHIATQSMGYDEDGDAINYALVSELAAGTGTRPPRLSPSERAAVAILADILRANEVSAVSEAEWRTACAKSRKVSGSENADSRRRAIARALSSLAQKSAVIIADGLARLPDRFAPADLDDADAFDDWGTSLDSDQLRARTESPPPN